MSLNRQRCHLHLVPACDDSRVMARWNLSPNPRSPCQERPQARSNFSLRRPRRPIGAARCGVLRGVVDRDRGAALPKKAMHAGVSRCVTAADVCAFSSMVGEVSGMI